MPITNVPTIAFTPTGLVLPAPSDVLGGVTADINAAFGGGVNPALSTPQGQLASSLAAVVENFNAQFANFVNQVNPDFASGFMQDAIGRIYLLTRNPAVSTAVQCNCLGAVGTVIPLGARAVDTAGNIYASTVAATIPASGIISVPFAAIVPGPIACPAYSLSAIYQSVPGWNTVINTADGVIGRNVESRSDFAYRRQNSVALNSHGTLNAIYANVFNVPNVIDVYAYQNTSNVTLAVGSTSYILAPHSIYIAVSGGTPADIANAIFQKQNMGCDMNGNTLVNVVDSSGYSAPLPTYIVKYNIPTSTPILFSIQIQNSATLPSNVSTLITNNIIAAFNGLDGGSRARIGATILASRYYAAVLSANPGISLLSIQIGISAANLNSVQMGIDQMPTISAANISVTLV